MVQANDILCGLNILLCRVLDLAIDNLIMGKCIFIKSRDIFALHQNKNTAVKFNGGVFYACVLTGCFAFIGWIIQTIKSFGKYKLVGSTLFFMSNI